MLDITSDGPIEIVRMNHGRVNAMDIEFCDRVIDLFQESAAEHKPIVLAGNGRLFSAGVDLKRLVSESESYLDEFLDRLSEMFRAVFEYPAPVVAAIEGPAIAGGCILASACDYRLISAQARIGIPELRIGVALPIVAVEIIRFVAAPQKFQQMVSGGATFAGDLAVSAGLADEVQDRKDQIATAVGKVRELADIPADVYAVCKKQMRAPALRNMEANRKEFEAENRRLWHDADVQQAIRQYVQERLGS